ncbi:MAG: 50S ribosomal protein L30e [Candidatus Micrarchaeota archaeon]|nr:50S ribosomal protein L30e [Candidatus Micrarchaeota archaeon]
MDVQKAIRMAVDTGEVLLGKNEAQRSLHTGKCKLVVLAQNLPADLKLTIQKKARLAGVPYYVFEGTSSDLGGLCGKPYPISVMAIIDEGDSEILSLGKKGD